MTKRKDERAVLTVDDAEALLDRLIVERAADQLDPVGAGLLAEDEQRRAELAAKRRRLLGRTKGRR